MDPTNATPVPVAATETAPAAKGRLYIGLGVFILGWVITLAVVPSVTSSDLSAPLKASLTTLLVVGGPKIFLIAAIAIMGKPGFAYLKSVVFHFFKQYGPPAEVGPWRYRIGLVMFFTPFVHGLLSNYIPPLLPGGAEARDTFEKIADVMLIASLFVLGGDFWDKLRALFVRGAKAQFPAREVVNAVRNSGGMHPSATVLQRGPHEPRRDKS